MKTFNVEQVQFVANKLVELNSVPIDRIDLTANGQKVPLSKETAQDLCYCGLNNEHYIKSKCYNDVTNVTFSEEEPLLKVSLEEVVAWTEKKRYWMGVNVYDKDIEVYKSGVKLEFNPEYLHDITKDISGPLMWQTIWDIFCTDAYMGNMEYEIVSEYNKVTKDYDKREKVSIPYLKP